MVQPEKERRLLFHTDSQITQTHHMIYVDTDRHYISATSSSDAQLIMDCNANTFPPEGCL